MAEKHAIGGRTFYTAGDSTVEQDYTFVSLLSDAGLEELTMDAEESPEGFGGRVLAAALKSGGVLKLLGCLLIPAELVPKRSRFSFGRRPSPGLGWTPAIGEETAAFLGGLTGAEDKAKIRGLVLTLLVSFFSSGIVSLWTTATSSDEPIPDDEMIEEESPTPPATGMSARSDSAVGIPSS